MNKQTSHWEFVLCAYYDNETRAEGLRCANCRRWIAYALHDRICVAQRQLDTLESFLNAYRREITAFCPHCGFQMSDNPVAIRFNKTTSLRKTPSGYLPISNLQP